MNKREFEKILEMVDDQIFIKVFVQELWKRQTKDEQEDEYTKYKNHVGFNKPDGIFFGKILNRILQGHVIYREDIIEMRGRFGKYWSQFDDK